MLKKVALWILVILYMAFIFSFSAQEAEESKETSSTVIVKVVKALDVGDKLTDKEVEEIAEKASYPVRKLAHFLMYALLAFLSALLIFEYTQKKRIIYFGAVLVTFLYACTDELHQKFVSGRSGQISDVLLDTAGGLFGATLLLLICRLIEKIKKRRV